MSIASHRTAIVALLDPDVRAFDYAPKSLPYPCAVVGFPTSYDAHDSFSSTTAMVLPVALYVGYADNRAAEDNLEALIDQVVSLVETEDAYSVVTVRDFGVIENAAGQPVSLACTVDVSVL